MTTTIEHLTAMSQTVPLPAPDAAALPATAAGGAAPPPSLACLAIAARHDGWCARQRDPRDVERGLAKALVQHQPGPIPDVGHAQAQVHVVGEQCTAIGREATRDREVVASNRFALSSA